METGIRSSQEVAVKTAAGITSSSETTLLNIPKEKDAGKIAGSLVAVVFVLRAIKPRSWNQQDGNAIASKSGGRHKEVGMAVLL